MSAIAMTLGAPATGLGFRSSSSAGSRVGAAAGPSQQPRRGVTGRGVLRVTAGNSNEGGLFAPVVVITRNVTGVKRFNQFRGKIIALHSQVITDFCKEIGAESSMRQSLIRTAKKNGGRLGFLA